MLRANEILEIQNLASRRNPWHILKSENAVVHEPNEEKLYKTLICYLS